MKRLMMILAVAGLMAAGAVPAHATILTFEFDPNDLLDLYPADYNVSRVTQPNTRAVHETYRDLYYGTDNDYLLPGHTQPTDYNTYVNWRNGLGEGEGLGSFSFYLRGEYPTVTQTWGEILVTNPAVPISATAAPGWNAVVVASTGPDGGEVAIWWTTDPTKYIRPGGADIGTFSFTADLYEDSNWNRLDPSDPHAMAGVPYRIWFADTWMNEGDGNVRALVFDDQGWGTIVPNDGTFSSATAGDSAFAAILTLSAPPIPEPAGLGLIGMALLAVRKKRN